MKHLHLIFELTEGFRLSEVSPSDRLVQREVNSWIKSQVTQINHLKQVLFHGTGSAQTPNWELTLVEVLPCSQHVGSL